jgi:hypothetical protein
MLAVSTLIELAWSMPRVIEFFDVTLRWLGSPPSLALGDYLCRSALDPLGQGLWASLMLLSTLFPTAVHLAFLLATLFAWILRRGGSWRTRADHLLGDGPPPPADLSARERATAGAWAAPVGGTAVALPPIHPQTLRRVTRHFVVVRPVLLALASLLAVLLLWGVLRLAFLSWEPLPRLLLLVATGDAAAVAACFGGG